LWLGARDAFALDWGWIEDLALEVELRVVTWRWVLLFCAKGEIVDGGWGAEINRSFM